MADRIDREWAALEAGTDPTDPTAQVTGPEADPGAEADIQQV
jgi:hypothetical protein